ncbi:MAG: SMC-Scp complex subunit ScpB [Alphaproteobacteria bacterium]|jgi:segregation and condensation protein B
MSDFNTLRLIEALLFASKDPVPTSVLAAQIPEDEDIGTILETLQSHYSNRGIVLENAGNAWAFRTASDLAGDLAIQRVASRRLSRAAMETMAIIAYHQPVTRAEIEDIRGVAVAKGTVDTLLEAGWIKPRGRKQTPGRPLMWGTTDAFLDHFGLSTVKELPGMEELKAAGLLDKREGLASLPTSEDEGDDEIENDLEMEDGEETADAGATAGTSADVIQLDQAR